MFNSWQNCWFHCFPVLSQKNLKVRWFNFLKLMLFCYKHTDKKKKFQNHFSQEYYAPHLHSLILNKMWGPSSCSFGCSFQLWKPVFLFIILNIYVFPYLLLVQSQCFTYHNNLQFFPSMYFICSSEKFQCKWWKRILFWNKSNQILSFCLLAVGFQASYLIFISLPIKWR